MTVTIPESDMVAVYVTLAVFGLISLRNAYHHWPKRPEWIVGFWWFPVVLTGAVSWGLSRLWSRCSMVALIPVAMLTLLVVVIHLVGDDRKTKLD